MRVLIWAAGAAVYAGLSLPAAAMGGAAVSEVPGAIAPTERLGVGVDVPVADLFDNDVVQLAAVEDRGRRGRRANGERRANRGAGRTRGNRRARQPRAGARPRAAAEPRASARPSRRARRQRDASRPATRRAGRGAGIANAEPRAVARALRRANRRNARRNAQDNRRNAQDNRRNARRNRRNARGNRPFLQRPLRRSFRRHARRFDNRPLPRWRRDRRRNRRPYIALAPYYPRYDRSDFDRCLPRRAVLRRLRNRGWYDLDVISWGGRYVRLTARRYDGPLKHVQLARCSGRVVSIRPARRYGYRY